MEQNMEQNMEQTPLICHVDEQVEKQEIRQQLDDLDLRVKYLEVQLRVLRREEYSDNRHYNVG